MIDQITQPILEVKNISKTFPGVKALDRVSLNLYPGEVLAVCGENGAGKSTLMKYIAGIYDADQGEGEMLYFGKKAKFKNTLEVKQSGIVLISQELSFIPALNVAENIYLGNLPLTRSKLIDNKKLHSDARNILRLIECDIETTEIMNNLSTAQKQLVEISRALAFRAKLVIFDEPTSSLTNKEKDVLFRNIKKLKANGVGIIYITHKLDEVFEISDRIIVLRDGKKISTFNTKETCIDDVIESMIGRKLKNYFYKNEAKITDDEILRVEDLSINGLFENISFSIHKGEIVGLYGLVGAGRTEIVETIFGIRKPHKGTIRIEGRPIKIRSCIDAVKYGIGLVPENRKEQGLVLNMSCAENISLAKLYKMKKGLFFDRRQEQSLFTKYKEKLSISTSGEHQKCTNLSGGNQQKVVLAKWLATNSKLLILDEPTRGIDVGSKAEIHKLIADLAANGIAILIISSEMPEIISICNRVITIVNGCISGVFEDEEITEDNLIKAIMKNS